MSRIVPILAYLIISSCLKSKIVLELSNISVVRDFSNIFSKVSPGRHPTVMLSSWSSWFHINHPFSKNLCCIPLSCLVKLNNNLESWKMEACPVQFILRDILYVCWRKMISSSIGPCDQLLDLLPYQNFDSSMGYSQIKSEPKMFVMLSYSWFFIEHTPLYSWV